MTQQKSDRYSKLHLKLVGLASKSILMLHLEACVKTVKIVHCAFNAIWTAPTKNIMLLLKHTCFYCWWITDILSLKAIKQMLLYTTTTLRSFICDWTDEHQTMIIEKFCIFIYSCARTCGFVTCRKSKPNKNILLVIVPWVWLI